MFVQITEILLNLYHNIKIHLLVGICIKILSLHSVVYDCSYVILLGGNVRAGASSRFKAKTEMTGEDAAGNH